MKKTPDRQYLCIDLKSFYASVECVDRGLDPLTTDLVVADPARTQKTICLAVSPSLKAKGVRNRCRVFEIPQHMRYVMAPPRMARYIEMSAEIYGIYLSWISKDDIHVYSIDEAFFDVTPYLSLYGMSARELGERIRQDVVKRTGIPATCGLGTNLYLAKVALDITAKHSPDFFGELTEETYRTTLWNHRPITDFWRVGKGYARRLEAEGLYTMGDIARCSVGGAADYYNEELLYRLFGVNAELLIDHAWGWEPCRISDIKAYRPESTSVSIGQVLKCPYRFDKARLIAREMSDTLALNLVAKGLVCDQVALTVVYDVENLTDPQIARGYRGPVAVDFYGREAPKPAHGSRNLSGFTSSSRNIVEAVLSVFDRIVNPMLSVRRVYVAANHTRDEDEARRAEAARDVQLDMFTDYEARAREEAARRAARERERKQQQVMLAIQEKYGKNALLKGMNLEEGATQRERNDQVGGHRA